jgi:hypothetical protein
MWNDSLSDAYWDSIDWIVEDLHPELVKHPHAKMEKRLKLATARFQLFDFGDLEDEDLFTFLEELVQIEEAGTALSDRELAQRFLAYLSAHAAIPSHTNYEKLNAILQSQDYQDAVLALFDKAIQDKHPRATQLQKSRLHHYGIRAKIQEAFQAGTSAVRAFDQLLPVALDNIKQQEAKQIEFENSLRRNRTLNTAHQLQDPETKQWITVKIDATYTGCTLRFPDFHHENEAGETVELILGIDFYNDALHALINNADFQQEPQMVYLGTLIAED